MTISFLTDEHVPRVFISTLRSNDFTVERAKDVLGQATSDAELLEYAAENELVVITHDKKDFGGELGDSIEHAGLVIYTNPVFLRRRRKLFTRLSGSLSNIHLMNSPETVCG